MGIIKKPVDIIALVKKNNGSIELTKDLYKKIYGVKCLTQSFLLEQKKQLAKHGIYIAETDRDSLLFSTPNKTINNLINYNVDVSVAKLEQQAKEYECRVCDVKLFESLDTALDLLEELNKYKDTKIKMGNRFISVFSDALDQFNQFYLVDTIEDVMEGLTDVKNKKLKPSEFIDKNKEFYDDINEGVILRGFNISLFESVSDENDDIDDDSDSVPAILEILENIRLALSDACEGIYHNYIDTPFN